MVTKETKTVSKYELNRNLKDCSSRPFMPLELSVLLLKLTFLFCALPMLSLFEFMSSSGMVYTEVG